MRIFNIKKPIINAICFIFVIIGIITCSYILTYDFSEVFESTVTDNYTDGLLFAVYVNTDDGYKEYSEVYGEELTNFSNLTSLKFTSSECRDYDNNVLSDVLTYNKGVINVDTTTTTYCTLYFEIYELDCVSEGLDLAECILRSENNFQSEEDAIEYIEEKGTPNFATSATTDEGLYVAEDDYGDSYYFRGTAEDNYVSFAGYYWRIVRINGDGSIRLIYGGTEKHENGDTSSDKGINSLKYQYNYLDIPDEYDDVDTTYSNAYVGYMYGDDLFSVETITDTTEVETLQVYFYYSKEKCTVTSSKRYVLNDAEQLVWSSELENYWTGFKTNNSSSGNNVCYQITEYVNEYTAKYDIYEADENGELVKTGSGTATTMGQNITYFSTYEYDSQYGVYYFDEDSGGEKITDYYFNGSSDIVGYYTCGTNYDDCSELYLVDSVANAAQVNAYVLGYATSDYESTHENINNSKAKTTIDNWYYTNIYSEQDDYGNNYSDYMSDTLFCADREVYSGDGVGTNSTQYQSYYRLYTASYSVSNPTLKCTNKNDRFTVSDTTNGNGALTYPIALITADEVVMAGGAGSSTSSTLSSYLARSTSVTMSPARFDGYYARVWSINQYGNLSISNVYTTTYLSPVINLKGSVVVTGGTGTIDDPYTVSLS